MSSNQLLSKFESLPSSLQKEVMDFIEYLYSKYSKKVKEKKTPKRKINFDWEGGLSHLKDKYTSVELQHKANEYR